MHRWIYVLIQIGEVLMLHQKFSTRPLISTTLRWTLIWVGSSRSIVKGFLRKLSGVFFIGIG